MYARSFAFLIAVMSFTRTAAADDTSVCIAASEAGQSLRDKQALLEAREKFATCSRDVCPRPIRADCMQQRDAVEAAMPSVVLRAKDTRGEDAIDVKVFCDGAVLATQLDGRARPVNPGAHVFRFEIQGVPPFERKVVVGEGEKNRLVVGDAPRETPPSNPSATPNDKATTPTSPDDGSTSASPGGGANEAAGRAGAHGLSIPGLIVGGIGVAATIPMAILWISGAGDVKQMRDTCAPSAGGSGCAASRIRFGSDPIDSRRCLSWSVCRRHRDRRHSPFDSRRWNDRDCAVRPGRDADRSDALPGGGLVSALAHF